MVYLPIIGQTFERITIDIVGPLLGISRVTSIY